MDVLKVVKRSPIAFPLALIVAFTMLFISEGAYWQSVRSLNNLDAIGVARATILGLQQSVLDAEIGERGYLLTGRQEYLLTHARAVDKVAAAFRFLDQYYRDKPAPTAVMKALHELTGTRLAQIAAALNVRQLANGAGTVAVGTAAAAELALSDNNREQMEAIGTRSAELLDYETLNVASSQNNIYQTLMLSRIGIALLSALSLLSMIMYLRQTVALDRQQQEQQRRAQAESERLESVVAQRTAQLTELAHHLQTAREDERNRLARNLHDELGALLTSAKLDAARIKSRLLGSAPEALERLAHLVGTLDSSIALGRRIIEDLRPSTLSNLGLVATLEILAREFAELSGIALHCALQPVRLEATAELVVYRLVQEAITNISKYADASNVWIEMAARDGSVEVLIRDDGVGFDPEARQSSVYGLVGMRYRVEAEGGTLTLVSAPGEGTLIQARLPGSAAAST